MDAIRQSPSYAEGQIRLLLNDLKNVNHAVRIKAVKRFQEYIEAYHPDIYDDDVDFMFCGALNEDGVLGLLHYCGLDSGQYIHIQTYRSINLSVYTHIYLYV
jgi:hypothetical protein